MKFKVWQAVVIAAAVMLAAVPAFAAAPTGVPYVFTSQLLVGFRNITAIPLLLWLIWYADRRIRKVDPPITKAAKRLLAISALSLFLGVVIAHWVVPSYLGIESPGF